ncbi:hypothetical protein [Allosphingosinicella indica]|uniref:Uncharacterized protein n=1 Tax=Allosphingosinicella indica TaxID=941907 RepID=A0A1X7GXP9_9SPHN|nr:hypothetical protein [Allosphingosinicella indica]SMF76380.1 hypothetical protein SAMN06295910_2448 [Allosphingosinicella indica]
MKRFGNWSIAAALAIVGAGLGVHLGNGASSHVGAARAESSAPTYASLVPNPKAGVADSYALQASTAGEYDYGSGCPRCTVVGRDVVGRDYVIDAAYEAPAFDGYEAASIGAQDGYRTVEASPSAEPAPEIAAVARYAGYPITEPEVAVPTIEEPATPLY